MKIYILAVLLSVVCFACAQQNQTGWNYNPYHFLAAAAGRGKRSIADAPDVAAAKLEHVGAHAVAANGVVSSLRYFEPVAVWEPPQSVQDTPEVADARAAHMAAHATARG